MRKILLALIVATVGFSMNAQDLPDPDNPCAVFAPNAFTPNHDYTNDEFRVVVNGHCQPVNYNVRVFDRFGRMVFESVEPEKTWDGTYNGRQVKEGSYLWTLTATYLGPDGSETVRLEEKGSVVLYR